MRRRRKCPLQRPRAWGLHVHEDPSRWLHGLAQQSCRARYQHKHCGPPFLGAPPSIAWEGFPLAAPPVVGTTSFSDRRGGSTKPGGSSIATLRTSSDAARGLTARAARCTSVCNTVLARRHVCFGFRRALSKGFGPRCSLRPLAWPAFCYGGAFREGIHCWPAPAARRHTTISGYTHCATSSL